MHNCCWFGFGLLLFGLSERAHAQSSAAFATRPYMVPNAIATPIQNEVERPIAPVVGQGRVAAAYRGPPPVTMFRADPPPQPPEPPVQQFEEEVPEAPQTAPRPPYSIVAQSQRDAQDYPTAPSTAWNPASRDPVVAPPVVATGPLLRPKRETRARAEQRQAAQPQTNRRPLYRRPMQRILQDTGTSIVHDVPDALADALPWVDRDRKNEPFESVLQRVADDLNRASQSDPEWALGAQREIRRLSEKLDRFPSPPPLREERGEQASEEVPLDQMTANGRPFRPRPIWPGASGRPEAQVRPATVVTITGTQDGPRAPGVRAVYVPNAEDTEQTVASPSTRPRPRTPRARR